MSISYFGRPYKVGVWKDILDGYGFIEIKNTSHSKSFCVICSELGTIIPQNKVYTDVELDYLHGHDRYFRSVMEQKNRTFCKYHLYMMYAEGVSDNP